LNRLEFLSFNELIFEQLICSDTALIFCDSARFRLDACSNLNFRNVFLIDYLIVDALFKSDAEEYLCL
jgi:hypothetical protein